MIGPASCDFILKGASSEEIKVVQDILDSYKEYDVTPGKIMIYESSDEKPDRDNAWMIDLSGDGVLKMKNLGYLPEHECRVIYEKEDRIRLIEQMALMISGMREKELDYEFDILPILEKTCRFICMDDLSGDIITKVVSVVKEMNKDAIVKGINDYNFLMQICDCSLIFATKMFDEIEKIEDGPDFTFNDQIILYKTNIANKGSEPKYGIVSIFSPI
ncbi:MAG: hypothetical protein IKQ44_11575 [Lachnospiraceae bacterium]|nr:hypothetical protein [Lachnospiraceae bacterium]